MNNIKTDLRSEQVSAIVSHAAYMSKVGTSLEAAAAITDCARVLFALQAMPVVSVGDHCAGSGMAAGFEINPDSVSVLLAHARTLIHDAHRAASEWHVLAAEARELAVVGGCHV